MQFNIGDYDLSESAFSCIKSGIFLMIGSTLDGVDHAHLPPIIIEIAKVLAYLGASVAFLRFIMALFTGKQNEQ